MKFLTNRLLILSILSIGFLNLFISNGSLSLWDQDESAYAGFAHHILESGDWVIPDFLWSEPHRKTPFHFWTIAVSFMIFGENEFAVRFPCALALLLTYWITYSLGKNIYGKPTALLSVFMMIGSLLIPHLAKISITDALLLLFETLAALSMLNFIQSPRWKWNLLFWIAVSMGVLVKGPPIIILTGGMWVFFVFFLKEKKALIQLHPWFFGPLALLPLLIWGRLAWLRDDGEFIRWMLDWYILKRASGETVFGQWGPPGYFLIIFVVSFLPYSFFIPSAISGLFKALWKKEIPKVYLYTGAWLLSGWIIYELIPSKLPSYALGAYPAFAILLAHEILQMGEDRMKKIKWGLFCFLLFYFLIPLLLLIGAILLLDNWGVLKVVFTDLVWFALGGLCFYHFKANQKEKALIYGLFQGCTFIFLGWLLLVPSIEYPRSVTKRLAEQIETHTDEGTLVVFAKPYDLPSMAFYVAQKRRDFIGLSDEESVRNKELYCSNRHVAIVFDKEKFLTFEKELEKQNQPILRKEKLSGWVTDMGKEIDYIIVYNY